MGKNKPRHNPNKPQNKYGRWCSYYEEHPNGAICECDYGDIQICLGNPHNCVKVKYKKLACRNDKQKIEGM